MDIQTDGQTDRWTDGGNGDHNTPPAIGRGVKTGVWPCSEHEGAVAQVGHSCLVVPVQGLCLRKHSLGKRSRVQCPFFEGRSRVVLKSPWRKPKDSWRGGKEEGGRWDPPPLNGDPNRHSPCKSFSWMRKRACPPWT